MSALAGSRRIASLAGRGLGLLRSLQPEKGAAPDGVGQPRVGGEPYGLVGGDEGFADLVAIRQAEREEGMAEVLVRVLAQRSAELALGQVATTLSEEDHSALKGRGHAGLGLGERQVRPRARYGGPAIRN